MKPPESWYPFYYPHAPPSNLNSNHHWHQGKLCPLPHSGPLVFGVSLYLSELIGGNQFGEPFPFPPPLPPPHPP